MSDLSKAFDQIKEGLEALETALGSTPSSKQTAASIVAEKPTLPDGPSIDEAKAALLEVVEAFPDGAAAATELLMEVEPGVKEISSLNPFFYRTLIEASKKYLEESSRE